MKQEFNLPVMIERVVAMHQKFGIHPEKPQQLSEEEIAFRIGALVEEFTEGRDATSREEEFDAFIDLAVFAIGTVDRMGMTDRLVETANNLTFYPSKPSFNNLERMIIVVEHDLKTTVDMDRIVQTIAYLLLATFQLAKYKGYASIFMAGFNRVQDANIAKELGANKNKAGGRGEFKIDLRKPEGWKSPVHTDLIESLGA